jgi:hypothetical protein
LAVNRAFDELGYYLLAGAGGEGPSTLMGSCSWIPTSKKTSDWLWCIRAEHAPIRRPGLKRFREDSVVTSIPGGIDHKASPEQIEHIATLIPDERLEPSATGSAQQCVDRIRREFAYGADALIMHGATPGRIGDRHRLS